ncbi:MAG: hypothetical protein CSA86_00540 [Arcobacter sp.]|nr:MAG: hypothetical protein CSA86_00540 [Arcobacter sp.]
MFFNINKKIILFIISILVQSLFANDIKIVYTAKMRDITNDTYGTYSNLATLLKEHKKNNDLLFLFGGNSLGPNLISNMDKGAHIISILNILKPDIWGVNHSDLMFGTDELSLHAENANFPLVLSNVSYENGEKLHEIKSNFILEKAGFKIGVISILGPEANNRYETGDIKIANFRQAIIDNSKILNKQGVDIIVLLTTGYFKVPKDLVENRTIDFVLSKYINSPNEEFYKHPRIINLSKENEILILFIHKKNKSYDFKIQRDTLLKYKKDKEVNEYIKEYIVKINSFLKQKVGITKVTLNTQRDEVRNKESIFANLLTDAIKEYAQADIALINAGSIRGDKIYKAGTVLTRRDIMLELPFRSKIMLSEIKGKKILEILEHSLQNINSDSGKFLHISGGKIIYDTSLKSGHRVKKVFINKQKLQKNKTYRVATLDFLYNGGDNYTMFKDSKRIREYKLDYRLVSDILIDYILEKKEIDLHLENRLKDLSKHKGK